MGLQLRLTHSLGDRLIDVEARPADRAVVVGRASNAEVQVPSANIAKAHCLLFVHEGHWVVQDAGSPSGTYLNGEMVGEPAFVSSGDVITLGTGSNPPTITVDPHGVGVTEEVEEAAAPQRGAPPQQRQAGGRPAMSGAAPAYAPPPQMPSAPPPRGFVQDDGGNGEESDNIFGAPAAAASAAYAAPGRSPGYPAPGYPSVPGYGAAPAPAGNQGWDGGGEAQAPRKVKKKVQQGTSGTTIAVVAVVAVVLVGGISVWGVREYQRKQAEANQPPAPVVQKPAPAPEGKGNNIFDYGKGGAPSKPGTPAKGATPVPAKPAKTTDEAAMVGANRIANTATNDLKEMSADPVETGPKDPEIAAAISDLRSKPDVAIYLLDEYRKAHPESKDADAYVEKAYDILWCQRLDELVQVVATATMKINAATTEKNDSQSDELKAKLQKEIAGFTGTRDRALARMKEEMKFEGTDAPNPDDAGQMAVLRKTRDPAAYKQWRSKVEPEIHRRHSPPWSPVR